MYTYFYFQVIVTLEMVVGITELWMLPNRTFHVNHGQLTTLSHTEDNLIFFWNWTTLRTTVVIQEEILTNLGVMSTLHSDAGNTVIFQNAVSIRKVISYQSCKNPDIYFLNIFLFQHVFALIIYILGELLEIPWILTTKIIYCFKPLHFSHSLPVSSYSSHLFPFNLHW